MLLKDEVQLLRNVPCFSRVDPCKLKLIAFASARICYEPGDILFHQGDVADAAYVILRGNAGLFVGAGCGEIKIGDAGAGSILGEMCVLCDAPRAATVRATMPIEALRIGKECLLKVIADNPRMTSDISRSLAESLRDATALADRQPVRMPEPTH
ncbi:cyclic nucleotide-binding domain-containing protein [Rhizobium sp. FY34]|uniref:cyclic nucleotide-binding domain-containing protein n=1 Tax=Rhizobium sp. FY34 TaxID=2562309 RepID=UPI0010C05628|nr:cyclic nucleotide-binding domain-containing protein [Rhizobium sp. FY34]